MASCSVDKDAPVKTYLQQLSAAMSHNKVDSIHAMYPGTEGIKEFHSEVLLSDSMTITHQEDGTVEVKLQEADLTLKTDEAGVMTVAQSHGLVVIDADKLKFAKATGWVTNGMADLPIVERLKDTDFEAWLSEKFAKEAMAKVSIKISGTFGDEYSFGEWVYAKGMVATVTNKNDFDLPSSCYTATFRDWYWADKSQMRKKTESGVDVPAKGTAKISSDIATSSESDSDVLLNITAESLMPLFYKHYQPTGKEYEEYQKK